MSLIPIAIRWDSWYSTLGQSPQGLNCLAPGKWQFRLPWFANKISGSRASCIGLQANMDLEIQLAAQAGIKAFMFDWYQWSDAGLYTGKQLYDTSPYNNLVKWCGAPVPVDFIGSVGYQARCNAWVDYFTRKNYLTVMGGRPILFLFDTTSQVTGFFGSYAGFKVAIDYLRAQTIANHLPNPYIVILGNILASDTATTATNLGADCIAKYAPPMTNRIATPYSNLDADVKAYWAAQLATGKKIIPTALTGWDPRPRLEKPESYTHAAVVPWQGDNIYVVPPSVTTVAQHVKDACTYAAVTQPAACESGVVLIYSWCECTEGGRPMIPTIGDPPLIIDGQQPLKTSNLLSAIGPVLRSFA